MSRSAADRKGTPEALQGRLKFLGRYRTRREIFDRIKADPVWKGAEEIESPTEWILVKGAASLFFMK